MVERFKAKKLSTAQARLNKYLENWNEQIFRRCSRRSYRPFINRGRVGLFWHSLGIKMEIIKTSDGYMIEAANGDYIHDTNGDNLFDTYAQAQALINQLETHKCSM